MGGLLALLSLLLPFTVVAALLATDHGGSFAHHAGGAVLPAWARSRIPPARLRALVEELLAAMEISAEWLGGDPELLLARRPAAPAPRRYVVCFEPAPSGDQVDAETLLQLAKEVKREHASRGLLVTPYRVARLPEGRRGAAVEILDGARLRSLVEAFLPSRTEELDHYRGFGS